MKKMFILMSLPYMDEVLKTRDSLTPKEAERRRKNILAGNPFAKYGYYPKVATLSRGKYLEFHDKDSIVVIGSVKYNTKQQKVIEVLDIDLSDPDAQPVGDTHGMWMSPDPLSEEFPSWSPYVYAFQNPLRNVDPTGLAPEDWGKKGNQWVWSANITKDNYQSLGYSDYSDGFTNNQYNSVNNTTVTLGTGGHWSEVPNTGFLSGVGQGISDFGSDAKTFFTETIFTEQFWGNTLESFFSNGHTNIPDYGQWNSYQWGHATGYETPNTAITVGTALLSRGEGVSIGSYLRTTEASVVDNMVVHGNSLKSLRPTWGYKLYSEDGTFLKNGITSQAIPESRYTQKFMKGKYMIPVKQFENRKSAWDWEFKENQINRGPWNKNNH